MTTPLRAPAPDQPLTRLGRGLDLLTRGFALLGTLAVLMMMAHITLEVVLRWIFGIVLPGTLVYVANYYMLFVLFLPFALLELRNRHLAVDVLTQHFPQRLQHLLRLLARGLTTAIMAVLTWAAWGQAMAKYRIGETIDQGSSSILTWPGYFALVAGCGLMTLVAALRGVELLLGRDFGLGPEHQE